MTLLKQITATIRKSLATIVEEQCPECSSISIELKSTRVISHYMTEISKKVLSFGHYNPSSSISYRCSACMHQWNS